MGGWGGALRGGLAAINDLEGNTQVASDLRGQNESARKNHADQLNFKIAPLRQQLAADQERLKTLVDSVGQPKLDANGKHADYDLIESRMAKTIGDIRQAAGDKVPSEHPGRMAETVNGIRQWLKMGGKNKQQLDTAQSTKVDDWKNQNTKMASQASVGALPYEQTPEGQKLAMQGRNAIEAAKARAQFGTGVVRHTASLTPQDAIKFIHTTGAQYFDSDGNEISEAQLAEFPPNTMLMEFRQGSKTFYSPADQNAQTLNVGGQIYQRPQIGGILGNTTDLGQATSTLPRETSHQAIAPTGIVTLGSETTRPTPGISKPSSSAAPGITKEPTLKHRGGVASSSQQTPSLSVTTPMGKQTKRIQKIATGARAREGDFKDWPSPLGNMVRSPGQARLAQQTAQTLTQVQGQITGRTKGDKPLWEFSTIYDDPELRNAMQTALRLSAGRDAAPEGGMFGQLTAGVRSGIDTRILNQALNTLQKKGGQEALTALGRLQEYRNSLVAVRTLSKAPATQSTIQSVLQEGPFMALNSQDFRSRLSNNLNTLIQGDIAIVGINPSYTKKLDDLDAYIQNWKPGKSGNHQKIEPNNKTTPPSGIKIIRDKHGNITGIE